MGHIWVCEHGSLAHKCEICERDDEIDDLKAELATLKATLERERQLNVYLYNQGYRSGHNDTVEAVYTDIHHSDMNSYHADVVDEFRPAALREGE